MNTKELLDKYGATIEHDFSTPISTKPTFIETVLAKHYNNGFLTDCQFSKAVAEHHETKSSTK